MGEFLHLAASVRECGNRSSVKKLRDSGRIPAVLYGGSAVNPKSISLGYADVEKAKLHRTFSYHHVPVQLELDGSVIMALLRDVQLDPCTDRIKHMDFQRVLDDQVVVARVPFTVNGQSESSAIKMGGKLRLLSKFADVKCKFSALPSCLHINVADVALDQWIRLRDLDLQPGVQYSKRRGFSSDPNRQVAVVELKKKR